MALVLVGLGSYSVPVVDERGVERRVTVRRGQDVSGYTISKDNLEKLKALTVRDQARRVIPVFAELEEAFDGNRHTEGGAILSPAAKKRAEEGAVKAPAPAVVVTEEAPVEEAPVEEAPVEKAPAKKATKAKKSKSKK
jgi:hypothetical protein